MTTTASLYQRYLPRKRWFEAGYWVLSCTAAAAANSGTAVLEQVRAGNGVAGWEPVVWVASS